MKVYQAIAQQLGSGRVTKAFGLMGEDVGKLIAALADSGIRFYAVRNEAGAVGMADGYARVSGDIGVAIVSLGPGLTNALTAIKTAQKAGSRIVVLAGATDVGFADPALAAFAVTNLKYIDQTAVLDGAGIENYTLRDPATAAADVRAVIERARKAAGPIVVNLPIDVQHAEAGDRPAQISLRAAVEPTAPDAAVITEVADLLEAAFAAQRPVVLAGRGAVRAGAGDELRQLAELTGALLGTTLHARAYFRGDPFDVGVVGTYITPVATELLASADLVLAFGASLNNHTTFRGELLPKARIVHFDSDPRAIGRFMETAVAVPGDARLSAQALVRELTRRAYRSSGYRTPDVARQIAAFDPATTFKDQSEPNALDPRTLLTALDRGLTKERIVYVDNGHHMGFDFRLGVPDPTSSIWPLDYLAMSGIAIPLGAALARPDRLTVASVGDGAIFMHLGEVDTAGRYQIPLLVLVMDDTAFGAEVQFLRKNGLPEETATFAERSLEDIAKALGCDGMTVRRADEIPAVLERARDLRRPLIVDCKITTHVIAPYVDFWERINKPPAQMMARAVAVG